MRLKTMVSAALFGGLLATAPASAQDLGTEHMLTAHGAAGDVSISVGWPSITVNPANGDLMVVWIADRDADDNDDGPADLFARRFKPDGAPIGEPVVVNDVPADYAVNDYNPPSVEYAPDIGEYLVTWNTDDSDVYAQRLDASGKTIGGDIPVDSGLDDIEQVKAAYSPDSDQWLIVYKAYTTAGQNITQQVYGRRYNHVGQAASNRFQISQMQQNADDGHDLVYATDLKKWLVVFQGYETASNSEVRGQFLDPQGNEVGESDFRISQMGPDGDSAYRAGPPRVAYDPTRDRFLVGWNGRDDRPGMAAGKSEVYVQLLDADGRQIGEDDRRLSFTGADANTEIGARGPDVVYNPNSDAFVTSWHADTDEGADDHYEILSRLLDGEGAPTAGAVQVVNPRGGVPDAGAIRPQLAYNPVTCDVWNVYTRDGAEHGDDTFETEVYGRRLLAKPCPPPPPVVAQPQPPPPAPPVVLPRRPVPPVLGMRRSSRQRIGRNGLVSVRVSCAGPCVLSATGTVSVPGAAKTYRLVRARRTLRTAGTATLKLKLSKSARRAVQRALRRSRRVTAKVTVTATDSATRLSTRKTQSVTARR